MIEPRIRNDFAPFLTQKRLLGYAAEIGVSEGDYSFYLLDRWPGICFQIDPWQNFTDDQYHDYCNVGQADQDARFEKVMARSANYKSRSRPMRMTSKQAAPLFEDGYFDFVYIDANHKLEFIREDIALWWPKVTRCGILAGHDYLDGVIASGDYGVKTAVTEFAAANNLVVHTTKEKDYPSWWVWKP
jgi:hypothetical protein